MALMQRKTFTKKKTKVPLDVDDVLTDVLNLSEMDKNRLEGKFTSKISSGNLWFLLALAFFTVLIFSYRLFDLQVIHGAKYAKISQDNSIEKRVIFAKRGVIKDRYGELLASNGESLETLQTTHGSLDVYRRIYTDKYKGLAHILGYVVYPQTDSNKHLWRKTYKGVGGIEEFFNDVLNGKNGEELVEKDASGKTVSTGRILEPENGRRVMLSIDARLNDKLYHALSSYLPTVSFKEGAAVIMDVKTGEVIAMVSVPEFDLNKITSRDSKYIKETLRRKDQPLLNRAAHGTYAPGSIVKPFVALAALSEHIINPNKKLLSTGALKLPNPYHPDKPTIFKDWRAHGWINMKEAIAHSSDEYFYIVGGGYKEQPGLGIARLIKYARLFGFGEKTGIELPSEAAGVVPSPSWKREVFAAPWNIGDTYHTAIGQYGFLITVLQAARYVSAIANGGELMTPTFLKGKNVSKLNLKLKEKDINVIHDGMRMAVNIGTARPLKLPGIQLAAKTGTAQTGAHNERKNSWVIGFWPYKNPRFAFAAMLSKGDAHETGSASHAMRVFFQQLIKENSAYVTGAYPDYKSVSLPRGGKQEASGKKN